MFLSNNESAICDKVAPFGISISAFMEINTRKGDAESNIFAPPSPDETTDYGRNRSRSFIDIDKEGQFITHDRSA